MSEYIVFVLCLCAGYGAYRAVWYVRDRRICKEYRALSDEDLQAEQTKIESKLQDFFGLRSHKSGCMPDKMLMLRHRCVSEEIERREEALKVKKKTCA